MDLSRTVFLVVSALSFSGAELIKFENTDQILCVTDSVQSMLYLIPPVAKEARNSTVLIENDEIWKDWSLKSSTEVFVPQIQDKRWEDLATTYTDSVYFEAVSSLALSVPGGVNFSEIISDVPSSSSKKTRDLSIDWVHWFYPFNNENATELSQFQVEVNSSEKTYFRVHDYKVRWANTVSETATVFSVSTNDTSCLMMYVYVCSYCFLNGITSGVPTSFFGTKLRSSPAWHSHRIELDPNIDVVTFEFFRNTTDGQKKGQWAVDLRRCPSMVANKTIYEVALSHDVERGVERKCKLGGAVVPQNTRQNTHVRTNSDVFSCEPGVLGKECDIHCSELFGTEQTYCEQHKICDNTDSNSQCFCSWGYEGDTCNKTCSEGKWGLSCLNKCNGCDLCKATTGECSSSSNNFRIASGLILLGITFKLL